MDISNEVGVEVWGVTGRGLVWRVEWVVLLPKLLLGCWVSGLLGEAPSGVCK